MAPTVYYYDIIIVGAGHAGTEAAGLRRFLLPARRAIIAPSSRRESRLAAI
jgi:NADPH-dependent 2,4-dienoyl-CoA reductase/sulfur reductase-like enzyme